MQVSEQQRAQECTQGHIQEEAAARQAGAHRDGNLTALEEAVLVEADDLSWERKAGYLKALQRRDVSGITGVQSMWVRAAKRRAPSCSAAC